MINWRDPKKELPNQNQGILACVDVGFPKYFIGIFYSYTGCREPFDFDYDGSFGPEDIFGWAPLSEINLPEGGAK